MRQELWVTFVTCLIFLGCAQNAQPQNVPQVTPTASSNVSEQTTPSPRESQIPDSQTNPDLQTDLDSQTDPDSHATNDALQDTEIQPSPLEQAQALNAPAIDAIPDDMFVCQVSIERNVNTYSAQSIGPTLEEAIDNSVDEACAIDCAQHLQDESLSEDDSEAAIEACVETCVEHIHILTQTCWQSNAIVYTHHPDQTTDDSSEE